jgi:predicted DNA-binding protein (MmcQ/YjbR family)
MRKRTAPPPGRAPGFSSSIEIRAGEALNPPPDPLSRLRTLCEALPGVVETQSWNHPNFRAPGGIFASFEILSGRPSIAIKAGKEDQAFLVETFGFFPTPYGAKQGWVSLWADGDVDWDLVERLVAAAHAKVSHPRRRRG